jgi:hypothetical protein
MQTRPRIEQRRAAAEPGRSGEFFLPPRERKICVSVRSYAVHVAIYSKQKQEKHLFDSIRVLCGLHNRFREDVQPLRCFRDPHSYVGKRLSGDPHSEQLANSRSLRLVTRTRVLGLLMASRELSRKARSPQRRRTKLPRIPYDPALAVRACKAVDAYLGIDRRDLHVQFPPTLRTWAR